MRTISAALLAEQKSASNQPYITARIENRQGNIIRLDFAQLDATANAITRHGACCSGTGALIRCRIEAGAVKVSRSASPETAISTLWQTLQTGKGTRIACAALSDRAIILYTLSDGKTLAYVESTDGGATFGGEIVIGAAATTVTDCAVAYKTSAGDLAIIWAESGKLWIAGRTSGGVFGAGVQHTTTQSSISGCALAFVLDWNIVATGVEATSLKPTVWTTIYGNGGDQALNTWGGYLVQQQAEADALVTYAAPALCFTDQYRMNFTEADAFTGGDTRAYRSALVTGLTWVSGANTWRTPAPVNYGQSEGLELAVSATNVYSTGPDLVLSAPRALVQLELAGKVLAAEIHESTENTSGHIDIDNTDGALAGPPAPIALGNRVVSAWGYVISDTAVGSSLPDLQVAGWEYRRTGGVSVLRIHLASGWAQLAADRQRTAIFHAAGTDTYQTILTKLFARAGLSLGASGASTRYLTIKPAFQIAPETSALAALRQALALLADQLIMKPSNSVQISEPLATDTSDYTFGTDHPIFDASIRQVVTPASQAAAQGAGAFGEAIDFTDAGDYIGTRDLVRDITSTTGAAAKATATAHLRHLQLQQAGGSLTVPPCCGLEVLDVVSLTDALIQPDPVLRRVRAIRWRYDAIAGHYDQQITLGAV